MRCGSEPKARARCCKIMFPLFEEIAQEEALAAADEETSAQLAAPTFVMRRGALVA